MTDEQHEHCWHHMTTWQNGLGSAGGDRIACCHCGEAKTRAWTSRRDPKHGTALPSYASASLVTYDDTGEPRESR